MSSATACLIPYRVNRRVLVAPTHLHCDSTDNRHDIGHKKYNLPVFLTFLLCSTVTRGALLSRR